MIWDQQLTTWDDMISDHQQMPWYDMMWSPADDMIWYDMIWDHQRTTWNDTIGDHQQMTWYDMVWFGINSRQHEMIWSVITSRWRPNDRRPELEASLRGRGTPHPPWTPSPGGTWRQHSIQTVSIIRLRLYISRLVRRRIWIFTNFLDRSKIYPTGELESPFRDIQCGIDMEHWVWK